MSNARISKFQQIVWEYYDAHGRHDLPWRLPEPDGTFDPYKIMVSEVMLQQTQVPRVIPKYLQFIAQFPDVQSLAAAELGTVLRAWSGLGYNRRAKFLWQAARLVAGEHAGVFPRTETELVTLPGVGKNTAGAIAAYAYNQPTVFIETNIRTVFIHHFFAAAAQVSDAELTPCIRAALPPHSVREWYWALMDYGTHLKQTQGNLNKLSKHYVTQSPFAGSRRQLRGAILKRLGDSPATREELLHYADDARTPEVVAELVAEGLVRTRREYYLL